MATLCLLCQTNETDNLVRVSDRSGKDIEIGICMDCLEDGESCFIFVCSTCGEVYHRNKFVFIQALERRGEFKTAQAYRECEEDIIIQGIDYCNLCQGKTTGNA